jgi:ferrous iron transport protein B
MSAHNTQPPRRPRIAIVGNPNCGKTSLFNIMTGSHQRTGNWPGVTVDRKEGFYRHGGDVVDVVDLPGVYSLGVAGGGSMDERIARDYIASRDADLVVNIIDASNIERNLYLTTQLIEMQVPMLIVLNMMDTARTMGLKIDVAALGQRIGVPAVGVVATSGEGLADLKDAIADAAQRRPVPSLKLAYAPAVETALTRLTTAAGETALARGWPARWLAVKLLENDAVLNDAAPEALRMAAKTAEQEIAASGEDADILIADARYTCANDLVQASVTRPLQASRSMTDRIDTVVLNRALGIPIFLGVMYLMFLFTVNLGSAFIDFFDILAGTVLVDGLGQAMAAVGLPQWSITVIADGIGGGIQTVATFIPVIGFLFLFLSVLEDTGYMARAAFVMDRFMRGLGLPGKSFVPMMVGFGCTVPAVMATRTLDNQRDRVLTAMMSHFMSCGARLPVFALFATAFFATGAQNVVFALYLIGIMFAVITGLLLKNTILTGKSSPFLMELPLYHMPTVRGVLTRTWERLKSFISKAGKFIIAVAFVLTVFNSLGRDGSFGNQNTDNSMLAAVGQSMIPVFRPMGIEEDNWPAAVGLFTGLFAKEVVVGTLDALYSQMEGAGGEEEAFSFWGGIQDAFATIPANLGALVNNIADPLGVGTAMHDAEQGSGVVSDSVYGAMAKRFDGQIGAFAYLIAILLYSPCMSALAAYYRELSPGWTAFVAIYATGLGYSFGVLTYQVGTFARHPASSTAWIGAVAVMLAIGALALVVAGRRGAGVVAMPAE